MRGENSAYNILVEFQINGQFDLPGNAGTAEARIATLRLDDSANDFLGWPLGTRFPSAPWRLPKSVLSFLQCGMKTEQGRRFDNDGGSGDTSWT